MVVQTQEDALKILFSDRRLTLSTLLDIDDKNRQRVPLMPNPIQEDIITNSGLRDIYVKPAQVGFTSIIVGDFYLDNITINGTVSVIVSYDEFSAQRQILKAKRYHQSLQRKIPTIPKLDHKCLPYHVNVQLADGTWRRVGDIVNQRQSVEVLSLNKLTGGIEPKPIISHFKYPSDHYWIKIHTGDVRRSMVTPNHPLYTLDGFKQAKDITTDDYIYQSNYELNLDQYQLVLGSLLGDASLENGRDRTPSVKFGQSVGAYAEFKHRILNAYSSEVKPYTNHKGFSIGSNGTTMHTFRLKSNPILSRFELEQLDAKGLAIWFCDDGSKADDYGTCRLHTESFDYDTNVRLVAILDANFGIDAKVLQREGKYFYISLGVIAREKLYNTIAPYVPECMNYKLPERLRGARKYDWNSLFGLGVVPYKVKSVDWVLTDSDPYNYEYNIEVADNHNYFTGLGLNKNSATELSWEDKATNFYSTMYIFSSRSYTIGRGEVIHNLLLDEYAFWLEGTHELIMASAVQRVPLSPRTKIRVGSTPNGEDNPFCEMYRAAKEGKAIGGSVYTPHAYCWFLHPEYKMYAEDIFCLPGDDTDPLPNIQSDEVKLLRLFIDYYGHSDFESMAMIRWRRYKIAELASLRRSGDTQFIFSQEFPEDDETCFMTAGDQAYSSDIIADKIHNCLPAPIQKNITATDKVTGAVLSATLDIWHDVEEGKGYVLPIDPGKGKISESVGHAWNFIEGYRDKEGNEIPPVMQHCATLAGFYDEWEMAELMKEVAHYYNTGVICPEDNLDIVSHLRDYSDLYWREDVRTGKSIRAMGWQTNVSTKPYMITEVSRHLDDIDCQDIRFWSQCKNIRRNRMVKSGILVVGADDHHDCAAIAIVCRSAQAIARGFVGDTTEGGWGDGWG